MRDLHVGGPPRASHCLAEQITFRSQDFSRQATSVQAARSAALHSSYLTEQTLQP